MLQMNGLNVSPLATGNDLGSLRSSPLRSGSGGANPADVQTREQRRSNNEQIYPVSYGNEYSSRRGRPFYEDVYRTVAKAVDKFREGYIQRRCRAVGPQPNLQRTLLNGTGRQQEIWTSDDSSNDPKLQPKTNVTENGAPTTTTITTMEGGYASGSGENERENETESTGKKTSCIGLQINTMRSIAARLLFVFHALIAVWRAWIHGDKRDVMWLLMIPVGLGVLEGVIRSRANAGNESRWFSLSVFCYLCSMIPAIWALQLALTHAYRNGTLTCGADFDDLSKLANVSAGKTNAEVGAIANFTSSIGIHLPKVFTAAINNLHPSVWLTLMEQSLLVILIIGRWLMPSETITADILSQLLLVWLAIGADIVDLFDTVVKNCNIFKQINDVYLVLIIWSISLLQFPVQLTGTGRKSRTLAVRKMTIEASNKVKVEEEEVSPGQTSFFHELFTNLELWSIVFTTSLQDGPFLGLRLYFLTRSTLSSYTMVFFTCKNTLVVLLQMYRLYGVAAKIKEDTDGRKRLLNSNSTIVNQSNQ